MKLAEWLSLSWKKTQSVLDNTEEDFVWQTIGINDSALKSDSENSDTIVVKFPY